ncbi:hypothetical protein E6O75_ATG07888 [Venturia nashicola]|uniref:Uncharacterized protein n=1 Tax=Venturia nashicola TaxID=86259 RepID=A0A4Z1P4B5_9PEZI|nr:hypothetical protein E6O75_ATG07888 [Venturia nashicola]
MRYAGTDDDLREFSTIQVPLSCRIWRVTARNTRVQTSGFNPTYSVNPMCQTTVPKEVGFHFHWQLARRRHHGHTSPGTTPPSRPYKPGQDVAITAIQARRRHHGYTSPGKTSPSRPYKPGQDVAITAIQARARRRHYCHISPGKTPPSRPYKQDVYTVSVPANRRSNSPLDEIRWKLESSPSSLSNQLAQPQSVPGEVEHGRANPCRRVIFRPAQIHPNLLLIWPPSSSHVRRESQVREMSIATCFSPTIIDKLQVAIQTTVSSSRLSAVPMDHAQ